MEQSTFWKRRDIQLLVLLGIVFISINFIFPHQSGKVYTTTLDYFVEMALILPPVLILMGLFQTWVSREFIERHMGSESGGKGMLLSFVFGTLPTGPLYIAFPIALALWQKGARVLNISIFLGAWAATKLPQVMVEIKFLGIEFTLLLQVLTIASIFTIGILMEQIVKDEDIVEAGDTATTELKAE